MADLANEVVSVSFRAIFDQFTAALGTLGTQVKEHTEVMRGHFEKLNTTVEIVKKSFMVLSAVFAGGEIFRESIRDTVKLTNEVRNLSVQLGVGTEQAGAIKMAVNALGIDSGVYSGAVIHLTRQLKSNEKGLQELGLATRDQNNHLKDGAALMQDAFKVLEQYKVGTDRNAVAMRFFGRGVGEINDLMRLTPAMIEEMMVKQRDLNLVVGAEGVHATQEYVKESHEAKDVFEAMGKTIGTALMPVLTNMAKEFAETGPASVRALHTAINALIVVFEGLVLVIRAVIAIFEALFDTASLTLSRLSEAVVKMAHGDFQGAWATLRQGMHQIGSDWKSVTDGFIKNANNARDAVREVLNPEKGGTQVGEGGSKTAPAGGKPGKGPSLFESYKKEFEQAKVEKNNFFKDDLEGDIAFWTTKRALHSNSAKDNNQIDHELYALKKSLAVQSFEEEIDRYRIAIQSAKGQYDTQIALAITAAQKIGATYGYRQKQYQKAIEEIDKLEEEKLNHTKQVHDKELNAQLAHNSALIKLNTEHNKTLQALGVISEREAIANEQSFNNQQFELDKAILNERLASLDTWELAYGETLNKIAALVDAHNLDIAKSTDAAAIAMEKTIEGALAPISSAVQSSVTGMIQGTTTMQKAMQNIGNAILGEFVSMVTKRSVKWLAGEIANTGATVTGTAAHTAAESSAGAVSIAMQAGKIIKSIMSYAAETFAGVFAFLSGFMGPAAAGPAAGSMAAVAAVASGVNLSAAGGFDIPAGSNPLVQAHQREMILPAKIADPLREMLAGGGTMGGATNITIHAVDAPSVRKLFMEHGSSIVEALTKQVRGFSPLRT